MLNYIQNSKVIILKGGKNVYIFSLNKVSIEVAKTFNV